MRLTPVVFAALVGCSDSQPSTFDALHASISDAVQEDQTYQVNARAMTTMPMMLVEVDRHEARLTMIVGDMGSHMGSMMHCTGIGGMLDMRDGMMSELDMHVAVMRTEATLGDARAEVGRHVGAMSTMLDAMGRMLDESHCGGM